MSGGNYKSIYYIKFNNRGNMNRVIKKLEINNIHNQRIMGKGITVAVLDSGISQAFGF